MGQSGAETEVRRFAVETPSPVGEVRDAIPPELARALLEVLEHAPVGELAFKVDMKYVTQYPKDGERVDVATDRAGEAVIRTSRGLSLQCDVGDGEVTVIRVVKEWT